MSYNKEIFIEKSTKTHGKLYDYSLIEYKNTKTKVKIICLEHGVFEQTPGNHMSGQGCPICGGSKKLTTNDFVMKSNIIHDNKYDYSLVKYENSKTKVKIICPVHGVFEQTPNSHLRGSGCALCQKTIKFLKSKENFIIVSKDIHDNKYDYSLVEYKNSKTKVKIICPEHGIFEQVPESHIRGYGCLQCSKEKTISKQEKEINDFITKQGIETITSDRIILNGHEIDIYIPKLKIAIEYDGLYWHSEIYKDKKYHINKTNECEKQGLQLIHIFEDEWIHKKEIVKSRLLNILKLTKNKIGARKTLLKEIDVKTARIFFDENHLQGYTNSNIKIGLFYKDELVSAMLFNKPRLGIGSYFEGYELTRFVNKIEMSVTGAASKLLKYFETRYKPKEIRSYADKRWSNGDLYDKLNFEKTHINPPSYWYIIKDKREHRFKYRKEELKKHGFDIKKTEHEIMLEQNIYRIYDCGTIRYTKKI